MSTTTKGMIWVLLLIVAVGAIVLYTKSSRENKGADQKVIRIGAPLSLTGTGATDGESIKHGLDLAQADLREKGIKVEIVYEDDGTDPKRTVSAMQKMISENKLDAIVGPTWSFLAEAGLPLSDQAKLVSYQPANTSEFVSTRSKYAFFGANKNSEREKPATTWLRDNNKKRVAIIVDKAPWGESVLLMFEKAAKAVGAEVVLEERIPVGTEADSMPTIIAKATAAGADAILATGYEPGLVILIQKVQQQKLGLSVLLASELPQTLVKRGTVSIAPENQFYVLTTMRSDEFMKKFEAMYHEVPGNSADRAYDGLMLLVDAIEKKDKDESLADYLHKKTNYKGFATTYDFDEHGDIVGGEWVVEKLK
jgi:branched-chain amino acid transport system substrate-binding protein